MEIKQYQKLAARTIKNESQEEMLKHFSLGISGELGEFVNIIKKYLYTNHRLNNIELNKLKAHLTEELGDILWYVAALSTTLEIDLDFISLININKLKERYPDGFKGED